MARLLRAPRFLLAVGTLAGTVTTMAQSPAVPVPSGPLRSGVFPWADLKFRPTPTGARADVADQPTATLVKLECHVSTLNPGVSSHPPHRHPQEEFIIIKEGALDVMINGRVRRAGPGSLLFFASNDLHNMTNVGGEPATYFVFQITTAATLAARDRPSAEPTAPGILPSGVFNWEEMTVKPTKTGERRDVVDAPTATCVHFECHVTTLNPGLVPHAAHRHPDEEIIIVKSGRLQVVANRVTEEAGPGSVAFFRSGDEHGLKNAGAEPATYFVLRLVTAATPRTAGAPL